MTRIDSCILTYWFVTGVLYSVFFIVHLSKLEDYEDLVRDVVWNSELTEDFIYWLTFTMCFIFGFYFVPRQILKWTGVIKKER